MQVSRANDVNIYNLSAGKSVPEWLDERKRRALVKKDVGLQRRIQLLQDFDMPIVSTRVKITGDGEYVMALGTYKPRMKCFEVQQLGLKWERCFDSEAVAFEMLADDYSKMIVLHCDRYVNIHAQGGHYYKLRIPKFGRDLAYHAATCDAYFVGDGSAVHRLNLEQGRFLQPYATDSHGSNVVEVNPAHQLVTVGTVDGKVEAWDPRSRQRVASLDVLKQADDSGGGSVTALSTVPEITSMAFRDALNMAVGTSTGKIHLYDIRASKPYLTKDHMYDAPIKKVIFHETHDQVISVDERVVKIWARETGKAYTSIESEHGLNDLAIYPGSGLMFIANEQPRIQAHYIPSLGPAPRWCSFLDNITEELEESATVDMYDDYKFVTKDELIDLGMDHLIGTEMLRAYMHGYFIDIRLYRKAKDLVEPFTVDRYMQGKIDKHLEGKRENRVKLKSKLPAVNKDLFIKLKDRESKGKAQDAALLEDDRFKGMFTDDKFTVDPNEEAYKLLNPVLSKLDERVKQKFEEVQEEDDDSSDDDRDGGGKNSDIESSEEDSDSDSSEEEEEQQKRPAQKKKPLPMKSTPANGAASNVKFFELKDGQSVHGGKSKRSKASLEDRINSEEVQEAVRNREGGHQMTFTAKKSHKAVREALEKKRHMQERQQLRRSIGTLRNRNKKNVM